MEDALSKKIPLAREVRKLNKIRSTKNGMVSTEPETVPAVIRKLIEKMRPGVDPQRVWRDWRHWTRNINGYAAVALAWLQDFIPTWEDRNPDPVRVSSPTNSPAPRPSRRLWRPAKAGKPVTTAAPTMTTPSGELMVAELSKPAPIQNFQWHASDLKRKIGPECYDERVKEMAARLGVSEYKAKGAVHGEAVLRGEIRP